MKRKCSFFLGKLVTPFQSAQSYETKTTFQMLFLSLAWIRGCHIALVTESCPAPCLRSVFFRTTVSSRAFGQARCTQLTRHCVHRDRWISPTRTLPQSELLGNLTSRGWLAVFIPWPRAAPWSANLFTSDLLRCRVGSCLSRTLVSRGAGRTSRNRGCSGGVTCPFNIHSPSRPLGLPCICSGCSKVQAWRVCAQPRSCPRGRCWG